MRQQTTPRLVHTKKAWCRAVHWTMCPLASAPPVFKATLYILRCRREGPARAIFISNGPRTADARCCAYHPGLLRGPRGSRRVHVRNLWASQGARKDFSWELTPQNREGHRPEPARDPRGALRAFMGFIRPNGRIKTVPAPVGTLRQPAGHRPKIPKMSVFTRRTAPGVYICESPTMEHSHSAV